MQTNNRNINLNQHISTNASLRLAYSSSSKHHTSINEFIKGEILKGEVINLRGTDIQILLSDGQTLRASLESSFPLFIGDSASFLVEQSTSDSLILKLLPKENSSPTDATVDKALEGAQLPKSDKNITVVQELLKNGMSIDKNSIINLLRQSATFRNASIETLAIMNKYHIPMTQENTTQLEAYRNFEFRLLEQAKQLTEAIVTTLHNLPEGSPLTNKLYTLLAQSSDIATVQSSDNTAVPIIPTLNTPDRVAPNGLPTDSVTVTDTVTYTANRFTSKPLASDASLIKNSEATNSETTVLNVKNAQSNLMNSSVNENLSTNDSVATQLNQDIAEIENKGIYNAALEKNKVDITDSSSLLEALIKNEFTLPYQKLTESKSITKFYEKLENDLEIISNFFKDNIDQLTKQQKNTIQTQTNNVKDNIDFMKTLNQLFGYVQLPMKLPNQYVHSELFVYTNKKSLQEGNQQVSVLLHLDMTHLGPIDFHLTLKNQHVTAKISIESPESMTLIEQHLPELSNALEAKGYSMTYEMERLEKETKVIRDALESNSGDLLMKRYSFDIRA